MGALLSSNGNGFIPAVSSEQHSFIQLIRLNEPNTTKDVINYGPLSIWKKPNMDRVMRKENKVIADDATSDIRMFASFCPKLLTSSNRK